MSAFETVVGNVVFGNKTFLTQARIRNYKKQQKASDEQLLESYNRLKNVWEVAKEFGMCGQSVHERLVKLNVISKNYFTKEDDDLLRKQYVLFRDLGRLDNLAEIMERDKTTICSRAKKLGLTDTKHKKIWVSTWKYLDEDTARHIFEEFKNSKRCTVELYCKQRGWDDLGFSRTMQKYFPDEWDAVIESRSPKRSPYQIGRSFEYRCRDYFKKLKYFTLRSPRSGGVVDVVAIKKGCVLFLQCKKAGYIGVGEWNKLYELAISVGAIPVMATVKESGRGILFYELTGTKDGSKSKQPMKEWVHQEA